LLLKLLLVSFESEPLLLEPLLDIHDFLLLDSELTTDLRYLVFQLLFKLDDAFLASLEVDCFSPDLLLKLGYFAHTVHKSPLSVSLLGFPCSSDLLNSFEFSLL
jgi:hypothetical protein